MARITARDLIVFPEPSVKTFTSESNFISVMSSVTN